MNASARADQLIHELIAEPRRFADSGRAYELLQTYFSGASISTLRPLLRSSDLIVQRAAAFVVSELGAEGIQVLDDVVSLMESNDRYLVFHAMESVAECARGARASEFMHIVAKLEDPDDVLRSLSMFLMSNAEASQLAAACALIEGGKLHSDHKEGICLLMDASAPDEAVHTLVHSDKPLNRRYGAVAAARLYDRSPRLIDEAQASEDADVVSFVRSFLGSYRGVRRDTTA